MATILTAALVYGLTGGLTPGPLMALVIAQTLRHGAREGVKTALVPLISDGPIIAVILLLMTSIAQVRPLLGGIALCGAAYLLYLARESWKSERPSVETSAEAPRSFLRGAAVNFLNPNPYLFWLTVGTPLLVKAWRFSWTAAALVIAIFFITLVGAMSAIALLLARSRERVLTRWYVPVMRALAALLVLFAAVMVRDAIALLG